MQAGQFSCPLFWKQCVHWMKSEDETSFVPIPEEEEEKGCGFRHLHMLLIAVPPHTIDILPYARDANIDTKCNTVRRFMIAMYGMQETHSIVLIQ